ncbi:MAG: peptidase dimerization domain-containing protein, partial [Actinobacteria bacterium]|nr:peptidase dimerization domain-containing protein [Actinomycetota bacterium]
MPQAGIDPVLIGAQPTLALNTIVSRSVDPSHMAVVNVGTFQAREAPNVIPDTARIGVSIRTKGEADRQLIHRRAEEIIKGICASYGANYDMDWVHGYGIVQNDAHLSDIARAAAIKVVGEANVSKGPGSSASEDFSA